MMRTYRELGRISGQGAERLLKALNQDLPIEFELDGDEVIIKAVYQVKPECRREFVGLAKSN